MNVSIVRLLVSTILLEGLLFGGFCYDDGDLIYLVEVWVVVGGKIVVDGDYVFYLMFDLLNLGIVIYGVIGLVMFGGLVGGL